MKIILHIDFNSYFASVEQQANPRLRNKPIGVTGGDRMSRTVLSTASVEAKRLGVKTGMQIWEAKRVCPQIIIIQGDSEKYLYCSKKFWNLLKDFSPIIEIFSIDEVFLELGIKELKLIENDQIEFYQNSDFKNLDINFFKAEIIAKKIKERIRDEIGEWMRCSIGISYNKLIAKLASSLQKPDGLVIIKDAAQAVNILDKVEIDEICGIGPRIKRRLYNLGISNFSSLRSVPRSYLVSSFKNYGFRLYDMARGLDNSPIQPFYEKQEVKSIGHRYTLTSDTSDPNRIRQILIKISEMVAVRLREKKLTAKTIHVWYRSSFDINTFLPESHTFNGDSMQTTLSDFTNDGLEIFFSGWRIFNTIWQRENIRMIGIALSGLKRTQFSTLSFLESEKKRQKIINVLDLVNNKFGEFTLKRGILLGSDPIQRKPNPYLSDRRFKL